MKCFYSPAHSEVVYLNSQLAILQVDTQADAKVSPALDLTKTHHPA